MTGLEGVTPEIAASGLEEALKVLRARRKRIIVFCLFRGWNLTGEREFGFLATFLSSRPPRRCDCELSWPRNCGRRTSYQCR